MTDASEPDEQPAADNDRPRLKHLSVRRSDIDRRANELYGGLPAAEVMERATSNLHNYLDSIDASQIIRDRSRRAVSVINGDPASALKALDPAQLTAVGRATMDGPINEKMLSGIQDNMAAIGKSLEGQTLNDQITQVLKTVDSTDDFDLIKLTSVPSLEPFKVRSSDDEADEVTIIVPDDEHNSDNAALTDAYVDYEMVSSLVEVIRKGSDAQNENLGAILQAMHDQVAAVQALAVEMSDQTDVMGAQSKTQREDSESQLKWMRIAVWVAAGSFLLSALLGLYNVLAG